MLIYAAVRHTYMEHIFTAKVIDSHRLTIPEPIWDMLGISEGDLVRITLEQVEPPSHDSMEVPHHV